MKLMAHTLTYGDRTQVRLAWTRTFFFSGHQPEPNRLITLDLPGLSSQQGDDIARWLSKETIGEKVKALVSRNRRELSEFGAQHWRYTVLDDFLEVENHHQFIYSVAQHFTLAEIVAFERKHLPRTWDAAQTAIEVDAQDLEERDAALGRIESMFSRTHGAAWGASNRVMYARNELQVARDRQLVAAGGDLSVDQCAELLSRLKSHVVRREITTRLGQLIADHTHDPAELIDIVHRLHRTKIVKDAITANPAFWTPISPWLVLPATVTDTAIDASNAVEVVVPAHYVVFEAHRVGPIVPGRRALCIPPPTTKDKPTYIRADRRLLFQAMERGGTIQRHGCTLSVRTDGTSIRPLLAQVEELIVLANLAPQRALQKVDDVALPPDHPLFEAADKAMDDHRWARIFADLLIEVRTGLDADVARRLVG